MKTNNRCLAIITLLLAALAAKADPVGRINDIKRDSLYIYGEATKPTEAEAYDAALNILQSNIQQWQESRDKGKTGRILRNMTFLADTIKAMRGDYHRVFAYVSTAKVEETVRSDAEKEAEARKGKLTTARTANGRMHDDPQIDMMLRALADRTDYNDFVALIMKKQKEGTVAEASRDITRQPKGSFLAIFNKTRKGQELLYLLAPREDTREDLITGQQVDASLFFQNRENYRFLWFVTSKKTNE